VATSSWYLGIPRVASQEVSKKKNMHIFLRPLVKSSGVSKYQRIGDPEFAGTCFATHIATSSDLDDVAKMWGLGEPPPH
jgi:hypothetical protein